MGAKLILNALEFRKQSKTILKNNRYIRKVKPITITFKIKWVLWLFELAKRLIKIYPMPS